MLGFFGMIVTGRLRGENWGSEVKVRRLIFVIAFEEMRAGPGMIACWVGRYKASSRFSLEVSLPTWLLSIGMEWVRRDMDHGGMGGEKDWEFPSG